MNSGITNSKVLGCQPGEVLRQSINSLFLLRFHSQSVKTTEQGGERGYDGGKKIKGRKRHVSADVLGLLLVVFVSSAALDDVVAAPHALKHLALATSPRLEVIWADSKYHNHDLNEWIATEAPGNWRLEVVRRPEGSKGFVLVPKRWVVERMLAWLGRCRRNSKDYEYRTDSSESMIWISVIHLMLKRLKPANVYRPFATGRRLRGLFGETLIRLAEK